MQNKVKALIISVVMSLVLMLSLSIYVYAQDQAAGAQPGTVDTTQSADKVDLLNYGQLQDEHLGKTLKSYEETLYKVALDTFEDSGNFVVLMPSDFGQVSVLYREGVPDGLKGSQENTVLTPSNNPNMSAGTPAAESTESTSTTETTADSSGDKNTGFFVSQEDKRAQLLGIKANLYGGRRMSWMRINSVQPVPMEGLVKGFEIWATGRDVNHRLSIIVEDANRKEQLVPMGSLNYIGWRRLVGRIPDTIRQEKHGTVSRGLIFKGFLVEFNLAEAYGDYYIYFDNLSAEISRYTEENIALDNPKDNW